MSASNTQFISPRIAIASMVRMASCAPIRGRNPYEHPRKSCSKMASRTSRTACCTTLSSTHDTPIGRLWPFSFGM
jgi:hypothetical protein